MRWRGRKQSGNVEDRRGMPVGKVVGGGIGLLILVVVSLVLGIDPTSLLTGSGAGPPPGATGERGAPDDSAGARV